MSSKSVLLRSWRNDDASDRCARFAHEVVRGKNLCRQHAEMWRTHWRIVDRIRALPARRDTL